jgi:uncharacterized protein YdhG (YjbR/CyaY superfamily)
MRARVRVTHDKDSRPRRLHCRSTRALPTLAEAVARAAGSRPAGSRRVVAYNMPGFKIGGSIIPGYAAFSKQCGLYLQAGAISAQAEEIAAAGLKATKTGITFSPRKPIPDDLVERLARASRKYAGA